MNSAFQHEGQRDSCRSLSARDRSKAVSKARGSARIDSLGVLYAHALAIGYEAEARYREFATHIADCDNDATADLFRCLAEFEAQRAFHLAKKSMSVEIPLIDQGEHGWLDSGAPVSEAHAFVFRLMTPRLALEIALHAGEQAKTFFERIQVEPRNASVRDLSAEFAREEQAHITSVSDALAHLPRPFPPDEELLGDSTIEQQA